MMKLLTLILMLFTALVELMVDLSEDGALSLGVLLGKWCIDRDLE